MDWEFGKFRHMPILGKFPEFIIIDELPLQLNMPDVISNDYSRLFDFKTMDTMVLNNFRYIESPPMVEKEHAEFTPGKRFRSTKLQRINKRKAQRNARRIHRR